MALMELWGRTDLTMPDIINAADAAVPQLTGRRRRRLDLILAEPAFGEELPGDPLVASRGHTEILAQMHRSRRRSERTKRPDLVAGLGTDCQDAVVGATREGSYK